MIKKVYVRAERPPERKSRAGLHPFSNFKVDFLET